MIFKKFRGQRRLVLSALAGMAGVAVLVSLLPPLPPGPYVEAESVVAEGAGASGAHIVIEPMEPDALFWGAVSPDLRTALTESFNSFKLWDVPSGHLLRTLTNRAGGRSKLVVFSPDGQSVLTTDGRNRKYVLWDVASGRVQWTLRTSAAVGPVRFSPDGRRLLSADGLGAVTLRDAVSGQTIRSFKGHSQSVTALAFLPDGRSALSAASGEVRRWDIESGRERDIVKGKFGTVEDVVVPPKGYSALSILSEKASDPICDTMKVWDVETGRELAAFTSSGRLCALSPDGGTVLSANSSGVERFDVASGRQAGGFAGDFGLGFHLKFLSNTPVLVSAGKGPEGFLSRNWRGRVEIWDLAAERRLASFSTQNLGVSSLNFSPGGQVVASGHVGGAVNLWDMNSGRRLQTFRGDFIEPDDMVVSDWIAGECDIRSDEGLRRPCTTAAVPSPDDRGVLSAGNDSSVHFWNADNSGADWRQGDAGLVRVLAFSPDGHMALSGSADGTIRLLDSATGREVRKFTGHKEAISGLAFLPDGARALSADENGRLKLWDVASGKEIRNFIVQSRNAYSNIITAMAVAPDGASALSGSYDGTVSLWDLRTGGELRTFIGHSRQPIIAVGFSPDGNTALSAGAGGTVKAWDIAAARTFRGQMWWAIRGGREVRTLSGYAGDQREVATRSWQGRLAFSPDGRTMLTGSGDGLLRLWDHVTGKVLATLLFSPGGSWLTITPEGFYDSSTPEKVREFAVVRGRDVCSDATVHDTLYRPDLVREKIAGDKEGKVKAAAAELNLDKACFGVRQ